MYDPNDDTDVTSGTIDGAQMETTSAPDTRYVAVDAGVGGAGGTPVTRPWVTRICLFFPTDFLGP